MTDLPFPRAARVLTRAAFSRVFEAGKRTADPLLALHWLAGPQPAQLGLAVSRKVDPRAVGRNRIKRVLRETFRTQRPRLAGGAYVVVARAPLREAGNRRIAEAFVHSLQRAGALPPAPPPGTMPPASSAVPGP